MMGRRRVNDLHGRRTRTSQRKRESGGNGKRPCARERRAEASGAAAPPGVAAATSQRHERRAALAPAGHTAAASGAKPAATFPFQPTATATSSARRSFGSAATAERAAAGAEHAPARVRSARKLTATHQPRAWAAHRGEPGSRAAGRADEDAPRADRERHRAAQNR